MIILIIIVWSVFVWSVFMSSVFAVVNFRCGQVSCGQFSRGQLSCDQYLWSSGAQVNMILAFRENFRVKCYKQFICLERNNSFSIANTNFLQTVVSSENMNKIHFEKLKSVN